MDSVLKQLLEDYKDYTDLFAKQIYQKEIWQEQTGCELDEYMAYISCCEGKLYSFEVWYEHTQDETYPRGKEWDQYKDHKNSMVEAHP